jgi:dipeptidyl aminopeptidase/acylaminoacyl peptidase
MNYSSRHLRFGWWALAIYVCLGIGLEMMHGFKIGWYLDVGNEARRLMFTLGHFHGTMLSLVNIAAGLTIRNVEGFRVRSATSWALIWAAILLPGGFLLGGFVTYDGDPGSGVWLVPIGALFLLYGVIGFALGFPKNDQTMPSRRAKRKSVSGLAKILLGALTIAFGLSAQAALPALIPREILFGNPARAFPQISPDGRQISWLAPDQSGVVNVWIGAADGADAHAVTNENHRPIQWYAWAGDSAHILYLQDNAGDEIDHLFSASLTNGNVRDLTPFRGVRAQNVLTDLQHPRFVLVALNLRDRQAFDMYRVDLETGAITLEATNPGDVLTWSTDNNFVIRAATAFDGKSGASIVRVRDATDKPWRDLVVMPFERALFAGEVVGGSLIAGFDPDGKSLIIQSALGVEAGVSPAGEQPSPAGEGMTPAKSRSVRPTRPPLHPDKGRLVRVNLGDGKESAVLAQDPECDVATTGLGDEPSVLRDPVTHAIQAVEFNYSTSHWVFLDPKLQADFAVIGGRASGFLDLISRDRTDRKWIIAAHRSDAPATYYLFDRDAKKLSKLYDEYPALAGAALAPKKGIVIKARDGLSLPSYLTTPPGVEPKNLPLVLLIHGGPWFRDYDNYDSEVQLLANRGYAVLQVNYRGSTGFGLKFLNAGTNEWGRGTQEDLFDAVQWAISEGIADPKRIAAMGWSGGGFATLLALEMRPEMFACGVDGVGPAELATLYRSFPSYWSNITHRWRRRGGDFDHNEQLNREVSPLYHVDKIRAPLLIGQGKNDPRVTIANSDAMVAALRKAKREVTYIVYPDEGHGFARPENNLDFYGRVEEFLAKHLGGRTEPWKKIEGATAEVR